MYLRYAFAVCAILVPVSLAGYAAQPAYLPPSSNGLNEYVDAATGGGSRASAITGTAEVQPSPVEAANLGRLQSQLQSLNANPTYQNLQNSEAIAESIAEGSLASNLRQGQASLTSPNVVDQQRIVSLLVPNGRNNHQVIATQPLPPIVVNQPGSPPAQISSGPPAVVRAAPVIYKIKPSVIYQQEVINKVPTPLSLNPVYVKVYKPGKKIDAPNAPVVQPQYPSYAPQYPSAPADNYAAPLYAPQEYAAPAGY